ncbi:MAG: metal-dependent phosphohydrolase [Flavipsychrobacter sp.]|jgi:(p)ppGpp synthase/HD superfamily hydrolase|nr:metal-dependent phosphohydrolase [Flavipsychrobacter sp.]
MEELLEKIRDYADKAHGNQMRKYTPERYIVHPVRVMKLCREYTDDIAVLAAALLHDVLEDTPVTEQELHRFLTSVMTKEDAAKTMKFVIDLTDVYVKKDFPKLNRRTRKEKESERLKHIDPESQTIKYADIIANCNEIVVHDPDFAKRFLFECRANLKVMNIGNRELYQKASDTVNACIEKTY